MKISNNPDASELAAAVKRTRLDPGNLEATVARIFNNVRKEGDAALKLYAKQFDGVVLSELRVSEEELEQAGALLSEELKSAIRTAAANIEAFHRSQVKEEPVVETMPGVSCWRKSVPVQAVGLYIPGGTAPLFSTVLMLGIPSMLAGCPRRLVCTPPDNKGNVHPAILYAAQLSGISEIYKAGGAQAIAAMALGTESISKADKIFGPGNQYVTAAKEYAQRLGIAIDLPAGPSEVLVAADSSVPPAFIASDLLAQAEHGTDSQVILLTDSEKVAANVQRELDNQLKALPRAGIAKAALENSVCIVMPPDRWTDIINSYAPEHLILMGQYEEQTLAGVVNAGSVFLGLYSAESFGDYASGTNHTLPTAGFARAYSGVSLDSFVKKITYQRISEAGLKNLGPAVITLAEAESLQAHANAVRIRRDYLTNIKKQ